MGILRCQIMHTERGQKTDHAVGNAFRRFKECLVLSNDLPRHRVKSTSDPLNLAVFDSFLEVGSRESIALGIAARRTPSATILANRRSMIGGQRQSIKRTVEKE